MRSNTAHGEMYSIQLYVIKFVSDLLKVGGFLQVFWFPPNKTDYHDITKILLKVALNATTLTLLILLGRLLQGSFSSVRVQFGVYITNSSSFNISFCFPFVSRYAVKNFSDVMHAE